MENTPSNVALKISIVKRSGETVEIFVSPEDEDLTHLKWSVMIARNGHVYAHRTVNKQKVYLGRTVMGRMLGRPLVKGESVSHLNGDSKNKTRGNLGLKETKALRKAREPLS